MQLKRKDKLYDPNESRLCKYHGPSTSVIIEILTIDILVRLRCGHGIDPPTVKVLLFLFRPNPLTSPYTD